LSLKIKDLWDDNRLLKKIVVDLTLQNRAFKDYIEIALKPSIKRELVSSLKEMLSMSITE